MPGHISPFPSRPNPETANERVGLTEYMAYEQLLLDGLKRALDKRNRQDWRPHADALHAWRESHPMQADLSMEQRQRHTRQQLN